MLTITHLINPVKVSETSDLYVAQPVTFESMRRAKDFAQNELNIDLVTAQYEEDVEIIPNYFTNTTHLTRSVLDVGNFNKKRKLPLLGDLLEKAYNFNPKADYIIYTNADIALLPHFYLFVKEKIEKGYDAFVINRRTISSHFDISSINAAYSEIGEKHPGYDCFVFKRDFLNEMVSENICIGAVFIGLALFLNIKLLANKFEEFGNEHLTFHIGNDQVWKNTDNNLYAEFNKIEFEKIKLKLKQKFDNVEEILASSFPSLSEE